MLPEHGRKPLAIVRLDIRFADVVDVPSHVHEERKLIGIHLRVVKAHDPFMGCAMSIGLPHLAIDESGLCAREPAFWQSQHFCAVFCRCGLMQEGVSAQAEKQFRQAFPVELAIVDIESAFLDRRPLHGVKVAFQGKIVLLCRSGVVPPYPGRDSREAREFQYAVSRAISIAANDHDILPLASDIESVFLGDDALDGNFPLL